MVACVIRVVSEGFLSGPSLKTIDLMKTNYIDTQRDKLKITEDMVLQLIWLVKDIGRYNENCTYYAGGVDKLVPQPNMVGIESEDTIFAGWDINDYKVYYCVYSSGSPMVKIEKKETTMIFNTKCKTSMIDLIRFLLNTID